MTAHSNEDLSERRETMADLLASWDLEGALPVDATGPLVRE